MTEGEAMDQARKIFGERAMVSVTRIRMTNRDEIDSIYTFYEVGERGDGISATVIGRGASWQEALAAAASPNARKRPAFESPTTVKPLDIDKPYMKVPKP